MGRVRPLFGMWRFLVAVVLAVAAAGCTTDNAWRAARDTAYQDNIQDIVREKLADQSVAQNGAERWEQFKTDDFQMSEDVERDPARLDIEMAGEEAALNLIDAGPVSLADCLAHGLEFNDRVKAARAVIRSVGGDALIANSRFLPRLVYDLSASISENAGRNFAHGAVAGFTLLEIGKDNPVDVSLREIERQALFRYEAAVTDVLSEVRLTFFTILLKQQQLAARGKLRDEFTARYDRIVSLEALQRVLEVDVLTAKLNVLNEESRINALKKEIQRQKMDLSHAMGLPLEMSDFDLAGGPEKLELSPEGAVSVAWRRSTRIAWARVAVFEQDRVVRQLIWDWLPDVHMQVGKSGSLGSVGVDFESVDGVYGTRPFAERVVGGRNDRSFEIDPTLLGPGGLGWSWNVDLTLPIFSGLERTGRYKREKAFLERNRHLLCDVISLTERDASKAYQTVLEEAKETDILEETVRISKERFRVQERLKELGEVTDDELETFRERFFSDQDAYFVQQIRLVEAQERLRREMRYFEPVPVKGE